ncbi:hypothetical protein EZV62_002761 [Acer yangbiense]|uniref:Uncharacterized protein n=1 Tax=Acer yangbiense TaxID=1000413 RepID=A0A5C7J018_9ROSI|nr:hypothetical protein EZV62_002761 [Acer yangbiense]
MLEVHSVHGSASCWRLLTFITPFQIFRVLHEVVGGRDGVVSVFPSKTFQLQSTRSWDFMGFSETVKCNVLLKAISLLVFLIMESGLNQRCLEGFGPPPRNGSVVTAKVATISPATNFAYDSVAIGAFHAMEKGILTTAPANQHRHQRLCHGYCQCIEACRAGAVGAIQPAQESFPIPTVSLRNHDFPRVKLYLNSTENPQVTILKSVAVKDDSAPAIHPFSGYH